jgi:hypothetical protein
MKEREIYYYARPNRSRDRWISALTLFFSLSILGTLLYFFMREEPEPRYGAKKEPLLKQLDIQPQFLEKEGLLEIKSTPVLEYIRQRLLYHSQKLSNDPMEATKQEFLQDFPGEKGRVLSGLLFIYEDYKKKLDTIQNDNQLDSYQKLMEVRSIREKVWGKNLTKVFFPESDYEIIERFYAYSDRYLKKHYDDDTISKRVHLEKAKLEIYGDRFQELVMREPYRLQYDFELKIMEREMSIMDENERTALKKDIEEALSGK